MKHAIEILEAQLRLSGETETGYRERGHEYAAKRVKQMAEDIRQALDLLRPAIAAPVSIEQLHAPGDPSEWGPRDSDLDDPLPERTCGDGESCESCS